LAARNPEPSPADGIEGFTDHHPQALKAQAERCRRLAAATYNREVAQSLGAMAEEYERTAQALSKKRDS
jgi:hypothetical protein